MSDPLEIQGLAKHYGQHRAVHDVSFTVAANRVVGLLGPNGSGKSTTLHCTICGHPHESVEAKDAFGFFPDDLPLPDALTAREVLAFHSRLRPGLDQDLAGDLMAVLGLTEHQNKMLGDFSHGMRRKIQLVLALSHWPQVLVMDEPMRGLDPEAAELMHAVIEEFAATGGAVLVATHDLLAAERDFTDVVVLADGEVVAHGSPDSIRRDVGATSLTDAFVLLTGIQGRVESARADIARLLAQDLPEAHAERGAEQRLS